MTTLQLRIDVGGTTHTYTDLDMAAGTVELGQSYRDGVIERDDVTVSLDVAALGPWASPLDIPAGRFRAELRDLATGEVALDGTLCRTGVAADEPASDGLRRWTIRVLDTAAADLDEALEALPVWADEVAAYAEAQAGGVRSVPATVHQGGTDTVAGQRHWSVRRLLEGALRAAGATAAEVPPLAVLRFRYTDASDAEQSYDDGVDRAYVTYCGPLSDGQPTGTRGTLPGVRCSEWRDRVTSLFGLLLDVRYAAWPSPGLVVDVSRRPAAEAYAAERSSTVVVDLETLALDGWDIETDPAEADPFVLAFANERPPFAFSAVNPATPAVYAAGRIVYSPDAGDDGETVPWRQPRYTEISTANEASGEYSLTFGRPWFDGEAPEPYLVALTGRAMTAALVYVEVLDRLPEGQVRRLNPVWARDLYVHQADRAYDVVRVQVEVDIDELAAVGAERPRVGRAQYSLEGRRWTTAEAVLDLDERRSRLTLLRAAAGAVLEVRGALVGPPTISARIEVVTRAEPDGSITIVRHDAIATVATGPGLDAPDRFDVEYWAGTGPYEGTPAVWPGTPGAVAEDVDPGGFVRFRARSVYIADGYTSAWAEAHTL